MIKHFHTHVSICPSFKYVYMPYQPEKKIFITEVRFLLLVLVYVCVCVRTFVHTFQFIGITRRIQRFTGRKLVLRCTCIDVEVLYYYFLLRVKQWNRKEELKYTCISVCMCVCVERDKIRGMLCVGKHNFYIRLHCLHLLEVHFTRNTLHIYEHM